MKKVPSNVVKRRSRELTSVFESFTPYNGMEGKIERIWITDVATDEIHLVGHTKGYVQVLVVGPESLLGCSAIIKITSVGRWSVFGDVIEIIGASKRVTSPSKEKDTINKANCVPCTNLEDTCACSSEKPEPFASESDACNISENNSYPEDQNQKNLIGLLLRKKPSAVMFETEDISKQELVTSNMRDHDWGLLDTALVGGILTSLLTIVALVLYVCS